MTKQTLNRGAALARQSFLNKIRRELRALPLLQNEARAALERLLAWTLKQAGRADKKPGGLGK